MEGKKGKLNHKEEKKRKTLKGERERDRKIQARVKEEMEKLKDRKGISQIMAQGREAREKTAREG